MKKVLIFRPNGSIDELLVSNEIDDEVILDVLGGDSEELPYLTTFETLNIAFLQNEQSKLMKLEPAIRVVKDGAIVDVLCGNIMVVGTNEEEYIGITKVQEDYVREKIKTAPTAVPTPFLIII